MAEDTPTPPTEAGIQSGPVVRLPNITTIHGVVIHETQVGIQWTAYSDESWTEVRLPLSEARKLLRFLAEAYKGGHLGKD